MTNRFVKQFSMRMTKSGLTVGVLLFLSLGNLRAVDAIYENFGMPTSTPQINAITFINHGLFSVSSILPYDTQNTLHFSNFGIMVGEPGFRFDFVNAAGVRRPAADFYNGFDAQVFAGSGDTFLPGLVVTNNGITFESAQLIISATNIFSRGELLADARGLVRVDGTTVDLSRSSIGVLPFTGGAGRITPTNFIPDVGVLDIYWGMNNDGTPNMGADQLARTIRNSTNFAVLTPQHAVTNEFRPFGFQASLDLTNATAYVLTNAVTPTNWIIQAIFVQTKDPGITFDAKFTPSTIRTNPYRTAIVQFVNLETNVLAGGFFTNQVYLIDRAASETNFVQLTNLTTAATQRPANYEVTRLTPRTFASGQKPNATNAAALIYNARYTNMVVTNLYSGYAFNLTNVAGTLPAVAGVSITNLPGRVEIKADKLNINRTRIRGEGIVNVTAKTLIGSNAAIDVQNLALDLGSPVEPLLVVQSLVSETIDRMTGDVFAWTGMWTNQIGLLATNSIPDPNNPGGMTNEVVTNVVDIGFHVLVVDATQVRTIQPVFVPKFVARSQQVTIGDTLRVIESLVVEGTSLTLSSKGKLILTNSIPHWDRGNFPNLRSLTNDGLVYLVGSANLGTAPGSSYSNIVNRGTLTAFNEAFRSQFFENSGTIIADIDAGSIQLDAVSARLEGGKFEAGNEVLITVGDLTIRNYNIKASQAFTLSVTNSVTEGTGRTTNIISSEGFHLLRKPLVGSLLGTTFQSTAPSFLEIPHTWAGVDRGPSSDGFVNNMAMGRLVINAGVETLHTFSGAAPGSALYVDFLEFKGITLNTITNMVQIDPGFTIYFANSNLTADRLNGLFGGRLRWVSGFVGSANSVAVVLRGSNQVVLMNQALRESTTIDSDGDGIPNAFDPNPRDDLDRIETMALSQVALANTPSVISFSWEAAPGKLYKVEYTTNLLSPDWEPLLDYTNNSQSTRTATVQDPTGDRRHRFYRVRADQ